MDMHLVTMQQEVTLVEVMVVVEVSRVDMVKGSRIATELRNETQSEKGK